MKTNSILGIAAVALLLSSCSKNETDNNGQILPNDPSRIGFGINTGSRGADNNLAALEAAATFNVVAVKNGDGGAGKTQYFNEAYKLAGGKWDWTGSPTNSATDLFNWPTDGAASYPMDFYSFFPTPASVDDLKYDDATHAAPDKAITIDNDIASQIDYLAAHTEVTVAPLNGRAAFAFKHILSKVLFKIQGTDQVNVNIQSIRVVNVQNQASRSSAPAYNLITGWKNPVNTAGNSYVPYAYKLVADATVAIKSNEATVVSNADKGALMLMPQYGTAMWDVPTYLADAKTELEKIDYVKEANGKYKAGAAALWKTNVLDKIQGSYIEVVYNIAKADNSDYTVGRANQFIRVGYPLDLTTNSEGKCWAQGKQYSYIISLGTADATGGILLDPFYTDGNGLPTVDPIDNPATVNPGDPINTGGKIGFDVSVEGWIDTPSTIK